MEFHSISLINTSLKILSKLLAYLLRRISDSQVDHSQTTFIKGCCILEDITTIKDLIFSMHKKRLPEHVIKVNFAKAFDMMD